MQEQIKIDLERRYPGYYVCRNTGSTIEKQWDAGTWLAQINFLGLFDEVSRWPTKREAKEWLESRYNESN